MENEMNTYRSSCPVAHNLANSRSNEEPESVDLLQMVPDASRSSPGRSLDGHRGSCGTIPHYPKTRSLDNSSGQRMHFVLLPREEVGDIDADSGVHICHTCRDSDIYNSQIQQQQQPQQTPGSVRHVYASRTLPDRTASHDDGSIYFNYLRFANTSSRTSPCTNSSTYEPVVRNGRPAKRGSHFKWFGSCCVRKSKPRKPTATAVQYAPGMDSHDDSDHVLQPKPSGKSKPRDWRRIKRLLLLAGVLLGILVALGGMVVGFLVLSPKNNGGRYMMFQHGKRTIHVIPLELLMDTELGTWNSAEKGRVLKYSVPASSPEWLESPVICLPNDGWINNQEGAGAEAKVTFDRRRGEMRPTWYSLWIIHGFPSHFC